MNANTWIERVIQALLAARAVVHEDHRIEEQGRDVATERFRFETLLSLVNAQTFESGALDATLGVAFIGFIAVLFPMFEHSSTVISRTAAGLMVVPAVFLAFGLFRVQTETPRAGLERALDLRDVASIAGAVRRLAKGHENNREKLGGKRALLEFALSVAITNLSLWGLSEAWRSSVVQWIWHGFH